MPLQVLISHAHAQRPLAEAWKELLETTTMGMVAPWYSSDASVTGGMQIGAEWRETIRRQIERSEFVLAILSPQTRDRPWIIWECGVMNGLARERASGKDGLPEAAVVPVIYSMAPTDLGNPLSSFQVYSGEDRDKVSEICVRLARQAGVPAPRPEFWGPALDKYMTAIAAYRPRRARNIDDMALWRVRIEQLVKTGRLAEVIGLRQEMYSTFGPGFEPVSIPLHDLLSSVMLETCHYAEAVEEANHGLRCDPQDVVLLHRKALALAEQQELKTALDTVKQLIARDPSLATNPEIGGLLGRINRDRWKATNDHSALQAARGTYERVARANQSDYYCALNAAELALVEGETVAVAPLLDRALSAARDAQQLSSFWADFTVGQVLIGKADFEAALTEYQRGLRRNPPPAERQRLSALRGAVRMCELVGASMEVQQKLRQILT